MKCINVSSFQHLSVEDLESKCYDKFDLRLEDLQILIAKSGNKGENTLKLCHMQKRKSYCAPNNVSLAFTKATSLFVSYYDKKRYRQHHGLLNKSR